ncbi:MAG TPA: FHA domain-containing serine/threonine-protein kinase [bacterium]|nr:FHA domain-containing serine/threonine-protein kinase [bacterium]
MSVAAGCGRIGKYTLLEEINSGIMSRLYKAHDPSENRTVALKTLKKEYAEDEEVVERFKREAKTTRALEHPNIIKIHDVGFEDEQHYFTMEYITGPTLRKLLSSEGALSVEKAFVVSKMVCLGLHYAHCAHVIHRDIKPSNIAIDENGNVIILDFGIAKVTYLARLTRPGLLIGTPEYMSPEQIRGTTPDGRADLYSLGIVLYELLTGTVPFRGNTHIEIAEKIVRDQPRRPSELNRELPKEVDEIVLKAIEKDRTKRFTSGLEMANAMNHTLGLPEEDANDMPSPGMVQEEARATKASEPSDRTGRASSVGGRTIMSFLARKEFWIPPAVAIGLVCLLLIVSRPGLVLSVAPWLLIPVGIALLVWVLRGTSSKTGREKFSSAELLLSSGGEIIQAFPIAGHVATIGRDQPDGIEIFKDSISRSHAQVVNQDGVFWVCDLNSTNGTFLNSRRIDKHVLRDGDAIGVGGETLVFKGVKESGR